MKSRLQGFTESVTPLTREEAAALDAELAAARESPELSDDSRGQKPPAAEPGLHWPWLLQVAANTPSGFSDEGEKPQANEPVSGVEALNPQKKRPWSWNNRWVMSIAASLLVGVTLGLLVSRGYSPRETQVSLADVKLVTRDNARVAAGSKEYYLEETQPFDGYASWVVLSPGEVPEVYPALGSEIRKIKKGEHHVVGPLPLASSVIILMTEQPASDYLRHRLDMAEIHTEDTDAVKAELIESLTNANYGRISGGAQKVPAEPAK